MNRSYNIRFAISFLLLFLVSSVNSQNIVLDVSSEPLNTVLIDIRRDHGLQLSFNDQLLSTYLVSAKGIFENPEEAISTLIKGLPLRLDMMDNVFIIYPAVVKKVSAKYFVSGHIVDGISMEALPYCHILINGHGFVTDFKGNFSYTSLTDTLFNITVSYLGYYILDSVIYKGAGQIIPLKASRIDIDEILVTGNVIERSVKAGGNPGEIRINHKVAGYLPGNGDNSVFNLLRLQPGILASGEQSNNLIIWGSYEGHSKVVFDGFTIFGLKNFNDNISAINPYLAKDIKVLKGGFGSEYGERVGGIVDIVGIDGNTTDPNVNLSINNMTLNGMASVPVFKNSALVLAFRQTYYDLYESVNLNLFTTRGNGRNSNVDVNVYPDYLFRDLNFKYSGRLKNGDNYFASFYSGSDNFSYSAEEVNNNTTITNEAGEDNFQKGMSAFYGKKWKNGAVSNLTLAYSGLNNDFSEFKQVVRRQQGTDSTWYKKDIKAETMISEMDMHIDNYFSISGNHTIKLGAGVIRDDLFYREDSSDVEIISSNRHLLLTNAYLSDIISITPDIELELGMRADYSPSLGRVYAQPRFSTRIKLGDRFGVNGSWGLYNQFISLSSVVDEGGNYRYRWTVCDGETIPVLSSEHYVAGLNYSYNNFQVSLEGYLKKTEGLTRYVRTMFIRTLYYGNSRSKGVDLFIKKQFSRHTAWLSYSLSKTEEFYPITIFSDYRLALHDQRHEIKAAAIFNFYPFYLSGNYVYGSGFADPTPNIADDYTITPYSRFDASIVYKFEREKYFFDAGISVLNILNTENIKYDNFVRIPSVQTSSINFHAEAVPRTFTIFLNLSF